MTPEYLNECFTWDYEGNLTWKERPRSHFKTDGSYKGFLTNYANKQAGGVWTLVEVIIKHQSVEKLIESYICYIIILQFLMGYR
jgi:hypothetical protein